MGNKMGGPTSPQTPSSSGSHPVKVKTEKKKKPGVLGTGALQWAPQNSGFLYSLSDLQAPWESSRVRVADGKRREPFGPKAPLWKAIYSELPTCSGSLVELS